MTDKLIIELDNDLTAITYDVIYNHTILSSLNLSWDSFDVYPPEFDSGQNLEAGELYRGFRSNLHSLIISSAALVENIHMRMYLTANIGFTHDNFEHPDQINKLQEVFCIDDSSTICQLFLEMKRISDLIFSIRNEFAHSSKAEITDHGLSNVHLAFDPEQGEQLTKIDINLTLHQFLEYILRMLHLLLDLKVQIEVNNRDFNETPISNIASRFVSGFTHAKAELRKSAVTMNTEWLEFETRVKDLSYY